MGGRKTPELKSCFKGMHASLLYAHVYREECPFPPAASEDVNRGYKQRLLTSHQLCTDRFVSLPIAAMDWRTSQMSLPGLRELLNVRTGVWPGKALCFGSETLKEMFRRTSFSCIWLFSQPVLTWGKIFNSYLKSWSMFAFFLYSVMWGLFLLPGYRMYSRWVLTLKQEKQCQTSLLHVRELDAFDTVK